MIFLGWKQLNMFSAAQYIAIVNTTPKSRNLKLTAIHTYTENIMSKSQDSKKAVKKEPAKTMKEKKEAKKLKKEESKRQ